MTQTASASSSTITARRCPQPCGGSTDRRSIASARSRRSSSGTRTSRRSMSCSPRRARPMAFSLRLAERLGMPTLHEIQDLFREALLGEPEPKLVDLVERDGLDPRARLAVYRHQVFITLTATLEAAFPVVCKLVDRRFFAYVADAFIRQHPPRSEEHTSELQSPCNLVCRLLLEKKKKAFCSRPAHQKKKKSLRRL